MSPDLELALRLADAADAISLARFRSRDLVVETKPDLTPVTEADREVEHELRAMLGAERRRDAILGEEQGASGSGRRRWIIDPIDGTRNYSRGVPVWATLIALEEDGQVVLGVVSAPALHRRWWAERGAGAHAGGDVVHVSRVARPEDAVLTLRARAVAAAPCGPRLARPRLRRLLEPHARRRGRRSTARSTRSASRCGTSPPCR